MGEVTKPGDLASESMLVDPELLEDSFFKRSDRYEVLKPVQFGTSGHRGTPLKNSFNEEHVAAIVQAICDYRKEYGITGPCFIGKDTHYCSDLAYFIACNILSANRVTFFKDANRKYVAVPVISRAIIDYNSRAFTLSDGIILTPSHNPPGDGAVKYNEVKGGIAGKNTTDWIERRANEYLKAKNSGIKILETDDSDDLAVLYDFMKPYLDSLEATIDIDAIRESGIKILVNVFGGSRDSWEPVIEAFGLNIELVNDEIDYQFSSIPLDFDGRIRMDPASEFAMSPMNKVNGYDLILATDPDHDRHSVFVPGSGLMNPNNYLSAALFYLLKNREWGKSMRVGKTIAISGLIDKIASSFGRTTFETPIGFKWFVDGLYSGDLCFAGEESSGANIVRMDGSLHHTEKDGITMCLLAAEMMAKTGKNPWEFYLGLENEGFRLPYYKRVDFDSSVKVARDMLGSATLNGDIIEEIQETAKGNDQKIGGFKISTKNGWALIRPSGTEKITRIYCESFVSEEHLDELVREAIDILKNSLK